MASFRQPFRFPIPWPQAWNVNQHPDVEPTPEETEHALVVDQLALEQALTALESNGGSWTAPIAWTPKLGEWGPGTYGPLEATDYGNGQRVGIYRRSGPFVKGRGYVDTGNTGITLPSGDVTNLLALSVPFPVADDELALVARDGRVPLNSDGPPDTFLGNAAWQYGGSAIQTATLFAPPYKVGDASFDVTQRDWLLVVGNDPGTNNPDYDSSSGFPRWNAGGSFPALYSDVAFSWAFSYFTNA